MPARRVYDIRAMRRLIPWLAFALAPILLAACGTGEADVVVRAVTPAATPTAAATATPSPGPTATPAPDPGRVTIAAVGDVMLARSLAWRMEHDGPGVPFEHVGDVLRGADIAVANLEMAISERGTAEAKTYTFRAGPIAADALAGAGIDVVGLANNHALDFGVDALLDTMGHLGERGIAHAGAGSNVDAARAPAIVEVGGLRIALLSYTDIPGAHWAATEDGAGVAWLDVGGVRADVAGARATADHVVVLYHFGIEGSTGVSGSQREQARAAIDAGATLVLGTHPHVWQEIEEYSGGLIAYSLGNFVFDGFDGAANETAILLIELDAGGVVSWELVPAEIVDGIPRLRAEE